MSQSNKIHPDKELLSKIGKGDDINLLIKNAEFVTSENNNTLLVFKEARAANSIKVLVALIKYVLDQEPSENTAESIVKAVDSARCLFENERADEIKTMLTNFYKVQGELPDELVCKIPGKITHDENFDVAEPDLTGKGSSWDAAMAIEVQ